MNRRNPTKFGRSTVQRTDYTPKHPRPDKYESFWGTAGTKSSKVTWSINHARHPVLAWAYVMHDLAQRVGTPEEAAAAYAVIEEVKLLSDFTGFKTFNISIAAQHLRGSASISRIG